MKPVLIILLSVLIACNNNNTSKDTVTKKDSIDPKSLPSDTLSKVDNDDKVSEDDKNGDPVKEPAPKTYSNTRFRDVTVEKTGENKFRIKGKAQIFEASFGWVIEDGHNELKTGFTTADMGAPEWGNFDFTVEAKKARPNSTLHIILFETSMKDGSRQHELPMKLD